MKSPKVNVPKGKERLETKRYITHLMFEVTKSELEKTLNMV